MTDSPEPRAETTTATEHSPRWDKRRGPNRLFSVAAFVVIVAGVVFIFAVVFWTGLIIGSHSGGGYGRHHGGQQGGPHHSAFWQHGPKGPGQWPGYGPPGMGPSATPSPSTPAPSPPARP